MATYNSPWLKGIPMAFWGTRARSAPLTFNICYLGLDVRVAPHHVGRGYRQIGMRYLGLGAGLSYVTSRERA